MKILIIGSDKIYAIENFYKKYIAESAEVRMFTAQNYFYDYYQKSIINKVIYRSGLSGIIKKINNHFKQAVEQFKPDVIWVFKGMEITPESLTWAKGKKIFLVNYNPDNPFIFTGAGSGNKNIVSSIPLYDLHFTYNLEIKNQLEKEYHAKTAFLPFGFDVSDKVFELCSEQDEIIKACFLGNPDKQRAAFITKLLDAGIEIDIYGNFWGKFITHQNLKIFEPVYGDEFWKILRRYRIQLNLLRVHNLLSHNMRTFEVPGIGGIQLAPYTPEHRMFFGEGKEIFLFADEEECTKKIKFLLGLTTSNAMQIRENARLKCIKSGYDYKSRAEYALAQIRNAETPASILT